MKQKLTLLLIFGVLNFSALFVGGLFTADGVVSDWYTTLNKAPWTPPGWVFGAAWFTIMILYSFFMTNLYLDAQNKKAIAGIYVLQWILNAGWNPVFFSMHATEIALVIIAALLLTVLGFHYVARKKKITQHIMLSVYTIWLLIATSLNAFIVFNN
jgi:tryptophan-rich sensory protein